MLWQGQRSWSSKVAPRQEFQAHGYQLGVIQTNVEECQAAIRGDKNSSHPSALPLTITTASHPMKAAALATRPLLPLKAQPHPEVTNSF